MKWKKILIWSIAVLVFFGVAALYILEGRRVLSEKVNSWSVDHRADCAVVLTGARGRVREGFDLLAQGLVKKLIVSGVNPSAKLHEIFPQWVFYGKLSQKDVLLERRSSTTYGNAQQTLPLVEALNCRDVVLITSQLHMYRAHRIFRSVYPPSVPIYKRNVLFGTHFGQVDVPDLLLETTKSLFYSVWAY